MKVYEIIVEGYKEVAQKFAQSADPDAVNKIIASYKELVNRNQVRGNERNIDWWGKQDWSRFQQFVTAKSQQKSQTQQKKAVGKGDSHILAENDQWLIVVPLNKDASCFHGKDTDWCTTKQTQSNFEQYFRDTGVTLIYFLQKQTGNKWAIAVHDEMEYFDKNDRTLTKQEFDRQTGIDSDKYVQMVSSGTEAYGKVNTARSNMRYDKEELERVIEEFRNKNQRVDNPQRDPSIETSLLSVKDPVFTRAYMYVLINDENMIELDQNMQTLVVNHALFMLKYISNLTDRSTLQAVKKSSAALQYIRNPSEDVQRIVIDQDPFLIRDIANPSDEIVNYALEGSPYIIFNVNGPVSTKTIIRATTSYLEMDEDDGGPDRRPDGTITFGAISSWLDQFVYNRISLDYEFYRWFIDLYGDRGARQIAVHFMANGNIINNKIARELIAMDPKYAWLAGMIRPE